LKELSPKIVSSLQIAAVFLVSVAVYFNTLFNGFVIDDSFQIIGNRWIRDIRYIPEIFSSNFVLGGKTPFYRPLVHVFYMISYHLFGLAPWGFHLMSIMFHAGVSVLVFLTVSRLLRTPGPAGASSPLSLEGGKEGAQWISFAAALLFATHPVHTEAVAWISVTDLYTTFFYLLSFYLYLRSSEGGASSAAAYVLSVVSFLLAVLCKEPALTLPVMLVAYDYVYRKEGAGVSLYKRYIPYLVAAGVYFGMRFHALGGMVTFKTPLKLSPSEYLIDILALFREYIGKLLLPVNLNVWHVFHPPATLFSFPGMVSLLVTAGFLIVAVIAIRKSRVALLGVLFIVVPLLPALYLPALTQGLENAFTERYLYLPSFGFILLAALLMALVHDRKPGWATALIMAVSAVVVLYSLGTVNRIPVWRDSYTLWTDVARKSPESGEPYNALGDYYKQEGILDKAIEQYQRGISVRPGTAHIHANLGIVYAQKGMSDAAIEQLVTALSLEPRNPEAHDSLGVIYYHRGQLDKAMSEFQAAVEINPFFENAYKHLAVAYGDMGRTKQAIESLGEALKLDPYDADAHNNLGILYGENGMADAAIDEFKAAIKVKPDDPAYHYNLAGAYRMKGLSEKAEEEFRRAGSLGKK
jgi:protein O-mannosyl-transferase